MKVKYYIGFGLLALLAVSCKPTEKGYKAAYDAALNKREAAAAEIDVNLPEGALQNYDGPQLKDIDGKQVYLLNTRLKPVEFVETLPGNYNIAVGTYKMITNSKAQSETLRQEGFEAFPAKTTDGMYYTIAGSFDDRKEAIEFYDNYKKKKDRVYVGLPNAPVIIYSPK